MKSQTLWIPLVALGLAAGAVAWSQSGAARAGFDLLTDEEFELAGLSKLTTEELGFLAGFWAGPPVVDFTVGSATAYLLQEGWSYITLHGPFDPGDSYPFADILHLAYIGSGAFLVEPTFSRETLAPGLYLVKKTGSILEIINPRGEGIRYSIEKEL
jgi:hypothetical protein